MPANGCTEPLLIVAAYSHTAYSAVSTCPNVCHGASISYLHLIDFLAWEMQEITSRLQNSAWYWLTRRAGIFPGGGVTWYRRQRRNWSIKRHRVVPRAELLGWSEDFWVRISAVTQAHRGRRWETGGVSAGWGKEQNVTVEGVCGRQRFKNGWKLRVKIRL